MIQDQSSEEYDSASGQKVPVLTGMILLDHSFVSVSRPFIPPLCAVPGRCYDVGEN